MAMSMRVTNANGRVIATKRAGVRSYHQHDALGNTIALINDSGVVTDTYTFWPYGELRTSTGTTTNPFKFCGAWGYYTDTTGRTYVRARTLRPGLCRWMTVDPYWPNGMPFAYVSDNPCNSSDSTGLEGDVGQIGGVQLCWAGKPTVKSRGVVETCTAVGSQFDIMAFAEIEIMCPTYARSRSAGANGSIPQWVKKTTFASASVNETHTEVYDDNMTADCANRKKGNPEYKGQLWGLHVHHYFGVDAPGMGDLKVTTSFPPAPTYPKDCTPYAPHIIPQRYGWLTWDTTFLTCCSCEPSPRGPGGHAYPTNAKFIKENCKEWTLNIKVSSNQCSVTPSV